MSDDTPALLQLLAWVLTIGILVGGVTLAVRFPTFGRVVQIAWIVAWGVVAVGIPAAGIFVLDGASARSLSGFVALVMAVPFLTYVGLRLKP